MRCELNASAARGHRPAVLDHVGPRTGCGCCPPAPGTRRPRRGSRRCRRPAPVPRWPGRCPRPPGGSARRWRSVAWGSPRRRSTARGRRRRPGTPRGRHPLRYPGGQHGPLIGGDHPRHDVQRERPLLPAQGEGDTRSRKDRASASARARNSSAAIARTASCTRTWRTAGCPPGQTSRPRPPRAGSSWKRSAISAGYEICVSATFPASAELVRTSYPRSGAQPRGVPPAVW